VQRVWLGAVIDASDLAFASCYTVFQSIAELNPKRAGNLALLTMRQLRGAMERGGSGPWVIQLKSATKTNMPDSLSILTLKAKSVSMICSWVRYR
jgi:hypothetical protein